MSRSMQWLSLWGGVLVLGYGVYRLFIQPDWIPIVLGLLIMAFSVSRILRSNGGTKEQAGGKETKD